MEKVLVLDTTLRDGEQAPGCSMHLNEKLEIARQLERLKVDIIEAGFAATSRGDLEAIKAVAKVIKNAAVASLSRARRDDIDASVEAIKGAVAPRLHIVLATSPVHMKYKLKMTEDAVLERIAESVAYGTCGAFVAFDSVFEQRIGDRHRYRRSYHRAN